MAEAVDWWAYFKGIRTRCPWSYVAYNQGKIDIVQYQGVTEPLGDFAARMYVLNLPDAQVESLCEQLDLSDNDSEWLFSYPGYGEHATPVSVLIQQHRSVLDELRANLGYENTADS